MSNSCDPKRVALARLAAATHGLGLLTEGQISRITDLDRVEVRKIIDDGLDHLRANPLSGQNGKHIMKQLGLE